MQLTLEDPSGSLVVHLVLLGLVRLALVRELLGTRSIARLVRSLAVGEAFVREVTLVPGLVSQLRVVVLRADRTPSPTALLLAALVPALRRVLLLLVLVPSALLAALVPAALLLVTAVLLSTVLLLVTATEDLKQTEEDLRPDTHRVGLLGTEVEVGVEKSGGKVGSWRSVRRRSGKLR